MNKSRKQTKKDSWAKHGEKWRITSYIKFLEKRGYKVKKKGDSI